MDRFAELKNESGRSLTEMMGVLAVMGIISVVGVKMFHLAMDRHQANELIYEAQKRATSVAAQIMGGKEKSDLSVAEFPDPEGHTFGVEQNPQNEKQFNITITGVKTEVCQKMKTMAGEGTTVRVVSANCDKLSFNDDLSQTAYASDNQEQNTCETAGHTWCGGISLCQEAENCCVSQTISPCQTCNEKTGTITNQPEYYGCDSDEDGHLDGYCNSSAVCTVPSTKICDTNADCTGLNGTYYCRYPSYTTYCTEDSVEAMNGKVGICTQITSSDYVTRSIAGLGSGGSAKTLLRSNVHLNWWGAKNFCAAVSGVIAHPGGGNWSLVDTSGNRLGCYSYNSSTGTHTAFGGTTSGYCCSATATTCDTTITDQSSIMQALRNSTTGFGTGNGWTAAQQGACQALNIHLTSGSIGFPTRRNTYAVLCE